MEILFQLFTSLSTLDSNETMLKQDVSTEAVLKQCACRWLLEFRQIVMHYSVMVDMKTD